MSNNEVAPLPEQLNLACAKFVEAREDISELQTFLLDKTGTILNKQEQQITTLSGEVMELFSSFEAAQNNPIENDDDIRLRLNIASDLFSKLARAMQWIDVFRVVDYKKFNETFKCFLEKFMELRGIIAEILTMFKGSNNDIENLPIKIVKWAEIVGGILPYLVDSFLKLAESQLDDEKHLEKLKNFLYHVKELFRQLVYCSQTNSSSTSWFQDFLSAAGGKSLEKMRKHKGDIEDYQLLIGNLIRELGTIYLD